MRLSKKVILITLVFMLCFCLAINVFAGDYTSSNPNKNSNYNRLTAWSYLNNYYSFQAPYEGSGSGTSSGTYYNFYNDDGDCTNFASQVLKAGGMSYLGSNRNYSSSWFYNGTYPNYSCTWTSANWFRKHWGNVNNVGSNRAYSYQVYTVSQALSNWNTIYYDMWEGDVIQHADIHGRTYH